jgi:hypothetical protein
MKTIKQKALVAALASAGVSMFSSFAGAVALSSEGTGETLLYPYYTARGATNTLLSVVNTTTQGKVVKVRFREAKDSRDVLDFNLFLSAYDVWTGAITQNVLGTGARLLTNDTSCTSPAKSAFTNLGNGVYAVDFFNFEYQTNDADARHTTNALAGPQSLDRTLDGYVEIIEMATVPITTTLYTAIAHVNGVPPCTASVVPPLAATVGSLGQLPPSGGLFGAATFVATGALGMSTSTNAVALNGFARTGVISAPNSDQPNLRDHNSCTAAVIDGTQVVVANMTIAGICSPLAQANAVTATLMTTKVSGEYSYSPDLAAATDWVITMPGKNYYTDGTLSGNFVNGIAPFTNIWIPKTGLASEAVSLLDTDREEGRGTATTCTTNPNLPECTFSPRPPDQVVPGAALNWESTIVSFGPKTSGASAVLAANNTAWFAGRQQAGKDGGWLEMTFTGTNALLGISGTVVSSLSLTTGLPTKAAASLVTFTGLPVIGFSIAQAKVTSAPAGQPLNNYQSSATLVYARGIR